MAIATPDQGGGMNLMIKPKATLPMIEKTRNPTTIARTAIGIRFQSLTIEAANGGGCWFISVMGISWSRASLYLLNRINSGMECTDCSAPRRYVSRSSMSTTRFLLNVKSFHNWPQQYRDDTQIQLLNDFPCLPILRVSIPATWPRLRH